MFVDFLVITASFDAMMCRSSVVNEQPMSQEKSRLVAASGGTEKSGLPPTLTSADSEQHRSEEYSLTLNECQILAYPSPFVDIV